MSPSPPDNTDGTPQNPWQENRALGDEIIRMAAEIDAANRQMRQLVTEINQRRQQDSDLPPFCFPRSGKHYLEAAIRQVYWRQAD
jgi:hypothetical protein